MARPTDLAERLRADLSANVDPATEALVVAWTRAYATIRDDLVNAAEAAALAGPLSAADFRAGRLGRAMNEASMLLALLNRRSARVTIDAVPTVVAGSLEVHQSYFFGRAGEQGITVNASRPALLDQIVRRTTEQIASRFIVLTQAAEEALRVNLVRAVASGEGARDAAARMVRETRGVFGGGLARAHNLARTELVEAHRQTAAAARDQMADYVTGWRWSSRLDARTCPACWSMHNREFPSAATLEGHQQCRCVPVPVLVWDDETDSDLGDPERAFRRLPRAQQVSIMGPGRMAALDAGAPWDSLATRRDNPGWRPAMYATPVRDL